MPGRFFPRPSGKSEKRPTRVRLVVERLEDRTHPSLSPTIIDCDPVIDPLCDPTVAAQSAEPPAPDSTSVGDAVSFQPIPANGPLPLQLVGAAPSAAPITWSTDTPYVFINGGTTYFAIRFDQPIDPTTVIPGVNVRVSRRDDPWFDPWTDLQIETSYDEATHTLTIVRPVNELGFRSSFAGSNYRILLGGNADLPDPIRAPAGDPILKGTPLGLDVDHPAGRDIEIDFTLDDGISTGKNDLSAGPAPAPTIWIVDVAPEPVLSLPLEGAAASGGGAVPPASAPVVPPPPPVVSAPPPTFTPPPSNPDRLELIGVASGPVIVPRSGGSGAPGGGTSAPVFSVTPPTSTPAPSNPNRLDLPAVPPAPIGAGTVRNGMPNLADPLSASPTGGLRLDSSSPASRGADRLDLGGFGDRNDLTTGLPAPTMADEWGKWLASVYTWIAGALVPLTTLPAPAAPEASQLWPRQDGSDRPPAVPVAVSMVLGFALLQLPADPASERAPGKRRKKQGRPARG